jgi:hypothetical protein
MSHTHTQARLHKHAGRIAVNLEGLPTFYLSTALAEKLGAELQRAAESIKGWDHYPTTTVKEF